MIEDVLGCTDVRNNKAFFDKQISCTNNAMSILIVGKRDFPEIAKVTDHGLNPQGPKGRFHLYNPQSHAIASHASDPAAATRAFRKCAKATDPGLNPKAPKGRFPLYTPQSHAIASHASDPAAAKAFL